MPLCMAYEPIEGEWLLQIICSENGRLWPYIYLWSNFFSGSTWHPKGFCIQWTVYFLTCSEPIKFSLSANLVAIIFNIYTVRVSIPGINFIDLCQHNQLHRLVQSWSLAQISGYACVEFIKGYWCDLAFSQGQCLCIYGLNFLYTAEWPLAQLKQSVLPFYWRSARFQTLSNLLLSP